MLLSEILKNIETSDDYADVEISDIVYDSRKAVNGTLFVCLVGASTDGHIYAQKAYENGCRAFLVQKSVDLPSDAVVITVSNTRAALAVCSCNFFSHPSKEIKVIGITGTKGKTTTANMIASVLSSAGILTGSIGTIGAGFADVKIPTVNTTPESYELQKIFRRMIDGGCKAVAIEVSSLGLKHHRVDGVNFALGIFTNLYPDHIGGAEHESFEEYKECKKMLFSLCDKAIICSDDDYTDEFISACSCDYVTYGRNENADYNVSGIKNYKDGATLGVEFCLKDKSSTQNFRLSMPGEINADNAVVTLAVADEFGVSRETAAHALEHIAIKGRAEIVETGTDYTVIIDYAHNGISLEGMLKTLGEYPHNRLIALYGSVGDRAQLRRTELGEASAKFADLTIVTTDDPGFESPDDIADEICAVIEKNGGKYIKIVDRTEAVRHALKNAQKGDIILLAGKGHEEFMKVNGKKEEFSERKIIKEFLGI